MNIFFQPDLDGNTLSEEESKHCTRVLRLNEGAVILLTDGKGTICEALLKIANPKGCIYEIIKETKEFGKKDFSLTIAIAPTKNIERTEWFLEKATEIGINGIIPLVCRYSERKEIKYERLEKVIISAMKQSQKAYLPKLNAITPFKDLLKMPFDGNKFIAHCFDSQKIQLKDAITKGNNTLICIGPEGDFSSEEVKLAIEKDFLPVSLGDSRLRTETAGLVACHTVNLINQ